MEIKVNVSYEMPTQSAFDALMEKYGEVKTLSAQTIDYFAPLADAAEEAKLLAILEQLEVIKGYVRKLNALNESISHIRVYFNGTAMHITATKAHWGCREMTVEEYRRGKRYFNADYSQEYNILGHWDDWNCYNRLEGECIALLKREIDREKRKAEDERMRLINITG